MTAPHTGHPAPETLSHIHRFVDGERSRPLLLLHGTGGDEADLLGLGEGLAPGAALLSPRGQVNEGGANRFFRRLAEGVFDVPDLLARTDALADFIVSARQAYGLGAPVAVGFSNGANIAAALLLRRPDTLAAAVLLRAMPPFEPKNPVSGLDGTPVLLLSGAADPIVPTHTRERLSRILTEAGAAVTGHVLPAGHGLTRRDVDIARDWLAQL